MVRMGRDLVIPSLSLLCLMAIDVPALVNVFFEGAVTELRTNARLSETTAAELSSSTILLDSDFSIDTPVRPCKAL